MSEAHLRLAKFMIKAKQRMDERENSYKEFTEKENNIRASIKSTKSTPTQKRKLYSALKDLQDSMTDVIEAEKSMAFMHKTKTEAERNIEKKIFALEAKLNHYMEHRRKRVQRFELLEKKIKDKVTGGSIVPDDSAASGHASTAEDNDSDNSYYMKTKKDFSIPPIHSKEEVDELFDDIGRDNLNDVESDSNAPNPQSIAHDRIAELDRKMEERLQKISVSEGVIERTAASDGVTAKSAMIALEAPKRAANESLPMVVKKESVNNLQSRVKSKPVQKAGASTEGRIDKKRAELLEKKIAEKLKGLSADGDGISNALPETVKDVEPSVSDSEKGKASVNRGRSPFQSAKKSRKSDDKKNANDALVKDLKSNLIFLKKEIRMVDKDKTANKNRLDGLNKKVKEIEKMLKKL